MAEPLLTCTDLTAGYGAVTALHEVSLVGRKSAVTAVVGANGAGKTTLLDTIGGTVRARAGSVTIDGEDITSRRAHQRARAGVVQLPEGRGILTHLTVAENLQLGLDWRGALDDGEGERLLAEQLERFPILAERYQLPAASLSGGEQQMLALARALMMRPRVLLLDEPSLGLAPIVVDEVFAHLARLKSEGYTILLVEQNAAKALELADYVYVLERGSIVLEGTVAEMVDDPRVREAYLPTDFAPGGASADADRKESA